MEYVMVPVPEELVDEVKLYLAWETKKVDPQAAENPDALREIYEAADPELRAVMHHVASAATQGVRLSLRELAEQLDLTPRSLVGAVTDANARLRHAGGPQAAMIVRPDARPRPDDVPEWEHRVVHMTEDDAADILAD